MAFKKDKEVTYEVKSGGINEIIDEKNNTALMLREVAWNGRESHLELRKWLINETGEKPMKGISFNSEDSVNNLVHTLSKLGYGNTTKIIESVKNRPDFDDSLAAVIGKKKIIQALETEVEIKESSTCGGQLYSIFRIFFIKNFIIIILN